MKVALISGSVYACPPRGYGSEGAVYGLARELDAMGHEVHLFAPGGSLPPGPLGHLHTIRGSYGGVSQEADADPYHFYRDILLGCDVVHDCSASCATIEELWLDRAEVPTLYTRNGIEYNYPRVGRHGAVVLSAASLRCALTGEGAWAGTPYAGSAFDLPCGRLPAADVVHYGVPLQPGDPFGYWPDSCRPHRFLYLSRPHPAKGTGRVIELARRCPDLFFIFAWRPASADHHQYDAQYRQQATGLSNVAFVTLPEVDHMGVKRRLLQTASALIVPQVYTEAFGLVAIEALACGTPVVLSDRGASPEIVTPGVTGFLVPPQEDELDELERAVRAAPTLSRAACRQDAVARWSVRRMAEDYVRLYERAGGPADDRFAWQQMAAAATTGRILNAGCKEDPAGLKARYGDRVTNLDRNDYDEDRLLHEGTRLPIPVDVRHNLLGFPWPFSYQTFELVILGDVLEDMAPNTQPAVLREARRVAARVAITCPEDTPERDAHHRTTITESRLRAWLHEAGWHVTRYQRARYAFGQTVLPGHFVLAEAVV